MTDPVKAEPLPERLLGLFLLGMAVAWYGLILWRQIDPDAEPRELLDKLRARYGEWRQDQQQVADTFRQIDELPEIPGNSQEG